MFPLQPTLATAGTVWIAADVLSFLQWEASRTSPRETGGVLLGYWSSAPAAPVVTHGLGPGPRAIHEKNRFVPDHEFDESRIASLYTESGSLLQYLGDWHSHPGCPGYLSQSDYATLYRICSYRQARAPRSLMIILGFGPQWVPVAWTARKGRSLIKRTAIVERLEVQPFRAT